MYILGKMHWMDRESEKKSRPVRVGTQVEALKWSSPRVRGRARGTGFDRKPDHYFCICTHVQPRQSELHTKQAEAVMMHRQVMLSTMVYLPHTLPLRFLLTPTSERQAGIEEVGMCCWLLHDFCCSYRNVRAGSWWQSRLECEYIHTES